mmetsp:Transcript_10129/g.22793  ORF Transcript_10129/g.22793 Transcript_10129/m.22793 type:complete len:203 (-) Transcript_10129:736-1344(-)
MRAGCFCNRCCPNLSHGFTGTWTLCTSSLLANTGVVDLRTSCGGLALMPPASSSGAPRLVVVRTGKEAAFFITEASAVTCADAVGGKSPPSVAAGVPLASIWLAAFSKRLMLASAARRKSSRACFAFSKAASTEDFDISAMLGFAFSAITSCAPLCVATATSGGPAATATISVWSLWTAAYCLGAPLIGGDTVAALVAPLSR